MSEALEALRAIDAINMTLADRMALVLRELESLDVDATRRGTRFSAYHKRGIPLHDYTSDEVIAADHEARSIELSRRLS